MRFFFDCFLDDDGTGSGSLSELSELDEETERFVGTFAFDILDFDLIVAVFWGCLTMGRFGRGFFLGFVLSALF